MQNPADRMTLRSTPEMNRYLTNSFARLEQTKNFDPTNFQYSQLQALIADNVIRRDDLTPEQARILASPGIIEQLNRDHHVLSNLSTTYRKDFDANDIETWQYLQRQTPDILASRFPNKEIGKNIMLRYDQQRFCQNLEDNNDIGNLRGVAIKLRVAYDDNTTKAELCERISRQLAQGENTTFDYSTVRPSF